ncbi:MAG: NAD(P)(+) transhydrogenase (Re/Si-specific) subunit alpha, partial [Pseudomonadota bacterium]|nr:NAD(P)(+) transhydrogenase (Re/Si-specific) subunit alpha [Pseudomonadota bacterium]
MQIFFPKEETNEIRATILPEVAKKFIDLGIEVSVETGLGDKVFVSDDLYAQAGAKICNDSNEALSRADIVCKINKP